MNMLRMMAAAAAVVGAIGMASAQPAGPNASAPGASAPRGGPAGPGRMGGHWGRDNTSGWSMMTPQERQEHRAKMQSMTQYDECKTYMDQHHEQMVKRAKDKGVAMPARPRRDACAGMKR
jgi:hypothetical protein